MSARGYRDSVGESGLVCTVHFGSAREGVGRHPPVCLAAGRACEKMFFCKIIYLDFSNWSDFKNSPDLNVLERVLIAVKFLSKNIEKQKSYPRFSKWGGS